MTSRPSQHAVATAEVAARRVDAPHQSMFWRMLLREAVLRRGRAASDLLAMIVAAAVATAMMNLYVDVQAKLRSEFRNYGANIVIVGKNGAALPADALQRVEAALGDKSVAVPFAYVVARTSDGQSVVVAGTDFDRVRRLNRWWNVSNWPAGPLQALVGTRAAGAIPHSDKPFSISFQGNSLEVTAAGTLQTGATEDSRIYLSLSDFTSWTSVQPSTIEVAASGSAEEVDAALNRLDQTLPNAEVRPVRQIVEGEARVLNKTRATLLAAAVLIVLTAALAGPQLIGWVFDRRRDFAIMKALGASEKLVNGFFAAEAAMLGLVGALIGYVIGIGVAAWIGRVNFHAPVVPRLSVLPWIVAGSVLVALISAVVPIGLLRRVQPAIILRESEMIQLKNVIKAYPAKEDEKNGGQIRALDKVSLSVAAGEWVAMMGPSGSGKSTMVNLIGALDRPTSGEIWLDGENVANFSPAELNRVRAEKIGFVFQQFHLIPFLTALENVMLAQYFHSMTDQKEALGALERVGLKNVRIICHRNVGRRTATGLHRAGAHQ
jgi:putative ABC transport system permease protein